MTYKVGDIVWVSSYESQQKQIPCPVCFENKQVIVISVMAIKF